MLCYVRSTLFLYNTETFDTSHAFLPLTFVKLPAFKQVHFFGPTLYVWCLLSKWFLKIII